MSVGQRWRPVLRSSQRARRTVCVGRVDDGARLGRGGRAGVALAFTRPCGHCGPVSLATSPKNPADASSRTIRPPGAQLRGPPSRHFESAVEGRYIPCAQGAPMHTVSPKHFSRSATVSTVVPGTGLEPVRPRGAARFKLAVSAFHHPGMRLPGPYGARTSLPHEESSTSLSGDKPPNSALLDRGCLILLATECPSAAGRGSGRSRALHRPGRPSR